MSAISGFINTIRNAVYGEQVRGAIISALEQCYSDVSSPSLNTAAFAAAIEAAYAQGFLDIQEKSTIAGMTNEKIIYRYTGNEAGYVHNALYYHDGTTWRPIGSGVLTASTAAQMTNTDSIYKYTGTESGYIQDALYFFDGTSWVALATTSSRSIDDVVVTPSYEFGTIADRSATLVDSTTRIRTTDYIVTNGSMLSFSVPSGLSIYIFEYTKGNAFVADSNSYLTGDFLYRTQGAKIKYVCRNSAGDSSITVSQCENISVKIKNSLQSKDVTIPVKMELGTLETTGTAAGYQFSGDKGTYAYHRRRSSYLIKCNGATAFSVVNASDYTVTEIRGFFYNATGDFISSTTLTGDTGSILIPSSATFIKFVVTTDDKIDNLLVTFFEALQQPTECKNTSKVGVFNYAVGDYINQGLIKFPPNYTMDGEKVPVVIYMPPSGHGDSWGGAMPQSTELDYVANEGLAVLYVWGWTTKYYSKYSALNGLDPYPVPITLLAYKKAIEYACSRYNLDIDNLHVMCYSQGGQLAYHYANYAPYPLRSIGMFSPVLDYFSMNGSLSSDDSRRAIAEELDFTGDYETDWIGKNTYSESAVAFFNQNIEKLNSLNEAWQGLYGQTLQEKLDTALDNGAKWWSSKSRNDIYLDTDLAKAAKYPVKIWGTPTDSSTPYQKMVEAVAQINNGGTEAILRTFESGNHALENNNTTNVTTRLGVHYDSVPTKYVENVDWIYSKMNEVEQSSS